jgi:hypothetical protein
MRDFGVYASNAGGFSYDLRSRIYACSYTGNRLLQVLF